MRLCALAGLLWPDPLPPVPPVRQELRGNSEHGREAILKFQIDSSNRMSDCQVIYILTTKRRWHGVNTPQGLCSVYGKYMIGKTPNARGTNKVTVHCGEAILKLNIEPIID